MASQRREYILRLLAERGSLRNATLARELQVTDETIRTDFIALEKMGKLRRCHGGAIYCIPSEETEQHPASTLLLPLIPQLQQQDLIYMDDSPLCFLLLKLLENTPLRLISNSPSLLYALRERAHPHHIISTGGELDKESGLLTGSIATRSLEENRPSACILCPDALHLNTTKHLDLSYNSSTTANWVAKVAQNSDAIYIAGRSQLITSLQQPNAHRVTLASDKIHGIYTEEVSPSLSDSWAQLPIHYAPLIDAPHYNDVEY